MPIERMPRTPLPVTFSHIPKSRVKFAGSLVLLSRRPCGLSAPIPVSTVNGPASTEAGSELPMERIAPSDDQIRRVFALLVNRTGKQGSSSPDEHGELAR